MINLPVVIACGQAKRPTTSPARDLYVGAYYRGCLRWALSVAPPSDVYIISAKYGLVHGDTPLPTYEQRLSGPGAVAAPTIARQARALGLTSVVFLGGRPYAALLRSAGLTVTIPFDGYDMRTGKQLGLMALSRGRLPFAEERARYTQRGPARV